MDVPCVKLGGLLTGLPYVLETCHGLLCMSQTWEFGTIIEAKNGFHSCIGLNGSGKGQVISPFLLLAAYLYISAVDRFFDKNGLGTRRTKASRTPCSLR